MSKRTNRLGKNLKEIFSKTVLLSLSFCLILLLGTGFLHAAATVDTEGTDVTPGTDPATWDENTEVRIGNTGIGTLTLSGGTLNSYEGFLGYGTESNGTLTVTGDNSKWINTGKTVYREDGSTHIDGGKLFVGHNGTGTLNVADGGTVIGFQGIIGHNTNSTGTNSTGTATVTGENSQWINSNSLNVGESGNGKLTVSAGGTVSNGGGNIALREGSTGEVTVTGENSQWINSGVLDVGLHGNGTLTVADGGTVSSQVGFIGNSSTGTGTVTVGGKSDVNAVSEWINTDSLTVGGSGKGTLTVKDGGKVSNTDGYIGHYTGSTGTVTVGGKSAVNAVSEWINTGNLYVGSSGTGTLTIEDNGKVTVGKTATVASKGKLINNGTLDGNVALKKDSKFSGTGFITGNVFVDAGATFDTNVYSGEVGSVSFADGGNLLFSVTDLAVCSTLNSHGIVNLLGANITVKFDEFFSMDENWTSFDLEKLFDFGTPGTSTGGFESTDWFTTAKWNITGLEIQGTDWEFDGTTIVNLNAPPSGTPEPATLLILGLGSLASVPAIRKRMKKS